MEMTYLRKIREENNLSAKQLADILGVEETLVLAWEENKCEIEDDNLKKLEDFFEVSSHYFETGLSMNNQEYTQYLKEKKMNDDFIHLLDSASEIVKPSNLQKKLQRIIDQVNQDTLSIKMQWKNDNPTFTKAYSFEEINKMIEQDDFSKIKELIPFMDSKLKNQLIQRLIRDENYEQLCKAFPYFNRLQRDKVIDELIKANYTDDFDLLLLISDRYSKEKIQRYLIDSKSYTKEKMMYLFPLMDDYAKEKVIEYINDESLNMTDLEQINVFLSDRQQNVLVDKLIENGYDNYTSLIKDLNDEAKSKIIDNRLNKDLNCKDYLPYVEDEEKEKVLLDSLKKNGQYLADICPFLNNKQMKLILACYCEEPFSGIEMCFPYFSARELNSFAEIFIKKNQFEELKSLNEYMNRN